MAAHRSPDGEPALDLAEVAADEAFVDDLAARRPVPLGVALAQLLARWVEEVDREPLPELLPALTDAAGSDDAARPGSATQTGRPSEVEGSALPRRAPAQTDPEDPMPIVDLPTEPIPRPRVRVTATPPSVPRIHPDYMALRDAPLVVARPPSTWVLLGAALAAGVVIGCLLGGMFL